MSSESLWRVWGKLGFLHYFNLLKNLFIRMTHPESPFEDHFCHRLSVHGRHRRKQPPPCLFYSVNAASKSGVLFLSGHYVLVCDISLLMFLPLGPHLFIKREVMIDCLFLHHIWMPVLLHEFQT